MRPRVVGVEDPDPARSAAQRLAELTGVPQHRAVVVLGSGWSPVAEALGRPRATLPMTELPGFVAPVAEGHCGTVASYDLDGVPVLVLFGRTHLYEGLGLAPVVHGVRTAAAAGCTTVVLTNANGSLRRDWELGRVVLVRDHLNLTATSPLVGARFVDLTDCWSPRLRGLARELDPSLEEAVYAWLPGPHYETYAEAEWVRRTGADVLGMSTVPESIVARHQGMKVLGISCITNFAAGMLSQPLNHAEVLETAEKVGSRFVSLLNAIISRF